MSLSEATAEAALKALISRVDATLENVDDFPYFADPETGEWVTTTDGNWCAGHWIGLLWLAGRQASGEEATQHYVDMGRRYVEKMRTSEDILDSLFAGMNYLYAGFDGYDLTGDRTLFGLGFIGADAMVGLFEEAPRVIPIGVYRVKGPEEQFDLAQETDQRPVGWEATATDVIHTSVPVLWRAYEETGKARFRDIALAHCDRHLDWCLRDDGSTWHQVQFEPETGELVRQYNDLAYSDKTCWARGLGWNISGLSAAYNATGARRYIDALDRSVDYYMENTPSDLVPYWDFEDPNAPDVPRDTSCAGIAASGLVKLSGEDNRVEQLRVVGEQILESIIENYMLTDVNDDRLGMITHGCYNKPADYALSNELIWTDYYVGDALETVLELRS